MNFKEAYKAMQEGKNVRRKSWKKNEFIDFNYNDKFFFTSIENALAEDWEVVLEKKKYWKPKKDEKYYFISTLTSNVSEDKSIEDEFDESRINLGNCFRTEEEAVHMIKKLNIIHELQKFAYENNEREIDWNDRMQKKHFIYYNHNNDEVDVTWRGLNQFLPFNIYFTSIEIAKKAIETIGEDRIKKYYFDVEE